MGANKKAGGAFQWTPKNGAGSNSPDAHNPEKHSPIILTTDVENGSYL